MATKHIEKLIGKLEDRATSLAAVSQQELAWGYLEHQKEVFVDCLAKNIALAKGRRWGGTRGSAKKALDCARMQPGNRVLWIDTSYRAIIRYIRQYFLPALRSLPKGSWSWNGQLMQLTFQTGSFIDFGSAERPELLEGAAYDFIFVNEAGLVLRNEDLYYNTLLPMAMEGEGANWFLNGTPKGFGLFHQLHQKGLDGDPEWASFQFSSYDNPIVNRKSLARYTHDMPDHVFRQEIMAEFMSAGGEFFQKVDEAAIATWEMKAHSPGILYVMGVDLGKAQDYTVIWVGRIDTRQAVYVERFNRLPWPDTVARIKNVSQLFNNASAFVDATGLGAPVTDMMTVEGIPLVPVVFNNRVKSEIYTLLASDLEHSSLTFAKHAETQKELKLIEQIPLKSGGYGLEAPRGLHDDTVTALALCNWGLGRPGSGLIEVVSSKFAESLTRQDFYG